MMKKISLPMIVTVMCVMVSIVLGLFWLNQNKKTTKVVVNDNSVIRTDYSTVARKTLDWIDQQRNSDGWYILERGCDFNEKTCDIVWDNDEGNKDGLIATWARFNFYNQTKDPKDLEIVKSDINKFYEKYPNGVDNALWICKITYDMWKSDLFDQVTKDKLEKICFGSKLVNSKDLFDEVAAKNSIRDEVAKRESAWFSWNGYSLILRDFDAYLNYSIDLVFRYTWKGDVVALNSAKEYFDVAKGVDGYSSLSINNKCLLGLSALDIFDVDKGADEYFKYGENIYNSLIAETDEPRKVATPICGLLIKKLYSLTNDRSYLKSLESFSDVLVKFNRDDVINKIVSDGGFYKSNNGLVYAWYKDVVENGLIVELIRD